MARHDAPDPPAGEPIDAPPERAAPLDRLSQRVLAVADAVGAFIEAWGFKAIHGRIWTLLALRKEPINQIDVGIPSGLPLPRKSKPVLPSAGEPPRFG